ncbi:MAG TPA: TlpA disulfide reductase family protein [Pyrinomonadaceae bacterium]|nr:TlpA disulfide reductase family protein [Pyrinomonadaceae bacterium]
MTSEQPASESNKKMWTGGRVALAALTFVLLAVALSSSCNPTDSSRDGSKPAPPPSSPSAATTAPTRRTNATQPQTPPAAPTPVEMPAEQLNASLTALDGKASKLADYKGKVVIINLWATWCGPCRREIPDFVEIQKDYAGRGVEVLGVTSVDERNTEEDIKEFVKEFKINYKIVKVETDDWASFLAPGYSIPQTFVLGQDGRLLRKFVGYSPQVAVMVRGLADQALDGGGRTDDAAK